LGFLEAENPLLRLSSAVCLWRIFKRLIHKHPHISDRAEGCTENIHFRLIKYLWGFPQRVKQSIEELRLRYPKAKFYEFKNDEQAHSFLNTLKKSKKYTYKPYSNIFPSLFQKEKKRISSSFNIALAIEHVGSTSIPGLGGKGIIKDKRAHDKNATDFRKSLESRLQSLTADMIKPFTDIGEFCREPYPCQHGPFEVELKDGRKVSVHLGANDIYSVLKALKDIGVAHKDWCHFSDYSTLGDMGWEIRPGNEVLTQIFENLLSSIRE
jgi:hypothetical protein